jgi:predicted transcriptional regulator
MPLNRGTQTISLYVPEKAQQQQVTQRLMKLGEKRDRSVNYLVVEAILQYLDREGA